MIAFAKQKHFNTKIRRNCEDDIDKNQKDNKTLFNFYDEFEKIFNSFG